MSFFLLCTQVISILFTDMIHTVFPLNLLILHCAGWQVILRMVGRPTRAAGTCWDWDLATPGGFANVREQRNGILNGLSDSISLSCKILFLFCIYF